MDRFQVFLFVFAFFSRPCSALCGASLSEKDRESSCDHLLPTVTGTGTHPVCFIHMSRPSHEKGLCHEAARLLRTTRTTRIY